MRNEGSRSLRPAIRSILGELTRFELTETGLVVFGRDPLKLGARENLVALLAGFPLRIAAGRRASQEPMAVVERLTISSR